MAITREVSHPLQHLGNKGTSVIAETLIIGKRERANLVVSTDCPSDFVNEKVACASESLYVTVTIT